MIDKEHLSALVDNENIDGALLDQLCKDEVLSSSWQHYHMIGDVMRGEAATTVNLDLTLAIRAAIAQEPAYKLAASTSAGPVSQGLMKSWFNRLSVANAPSWLKASGQLAVAASVAMLVITGVQYSNTDAPQPGLEPALNMLPFGGVAAPVSLNIEAPDTRQMVPQLSDEEKVEQVRRINAFVLDHQLQKRIQQ